MPQVETEIEAGLGLGSRRNRLSLRITTGIIQESTRYRTMSQEGDVRHDCTACEQLLIASRDAW